MGTSSSSSGPVGGVPFDPSWLEPSQPEQNHQQTLPTTPPEVAPRSRFRYARQELGKYISSGDRGYLKKALGSYSRKGMGGASKLAHRMRMSAFVGAKLFNFLQEVGNITDTKFKDWVNTSENPSEYEVADKIIDQVISTGGSLEEESCRDSMAQAMSDLLRNDSHVDLLKMDNDSIWTLMELFMANEAFNRLSLDIGQLFESKKYSPKAVSRMNDMRDYLKSEISVQIQELRKDTSNPTKAEMYSLLQSAIKKTFEVYEEEA